MVQRTPCGEKNNFAVNVGRFFFKYRSYLFVPILICLIIFTKPSMPFSSEIADYVTDFFGLIAALLGFFIRALVIGYKKPGTSGRGTNISVSEVVTDGAYRMCRNPLYFANFLIWLGFTIIWWDLYFFLAIVIWFSVEYFFIIKAEESYLSQKFGTVYEDFRKSSPAFFPKVGNYKNPDRLFNWPKVLKNETNLLLLILVFPLLFEIYENKLWNELNFSKNVILISIVLIIVIGWAIVYYKVRSSEKQQKI